MNYLILQSMENNDSSAKKTKNSKSIILLAGFSFIIPLLLLNIYDSSSLELSFSDIKLKKMTVDSAEPALNIKTAVKIKPNLLKNNNLKADSKKKSHNNHKLGAEKKELYLAINLDSIVYTKKADSSGHRIMIMGDSECGGLFSVLNDYCYQNGHELVASLVWNSATILNFAYSDTVIKAINKYEPTFIFIVVGLNEIYASDLKKRKSAAEILANKIKGIPYAWIGPANYAEDNGINAAFASAAEPGSFFLSKDLNLPKGQDGRHPNSLGYQIWMAAIANWLETEAKYHLEMKHPAIRGQKIRAKIINLNAAKYRGY